ncbi:MAG: small acid-soluble spore protein P [Gorillibacterium sp.]|nr:small acid-soluble spore protein P [Gorillibacterium sp.]
MNVHKLCSGSLTLKQSFNQQLEEALAVPVNIPQPTNPPTGNNSKEEHENTQKKPLSGSKKVKNRNHSRNNHGEGS